MIGKTNYTNSSNWPLENWRGIISLQYRRGFVFGRDDVDHVLQQQGGDERRPQIVEFSMAPAKRPKGWRKALAK